ncbi:conserved hypothetical protein [Candidatus Protochlamydia naegleriophila]|uniref:Uncharacterized protein n=1 Tax=Candidatus Protochlamydia naegleriophila TaxID=389348 RepID=A0A0U5JBJ9_9BACT|nr:ligase-associated DNA damage response exonuclease [Candidatus Protochlamydia naegleriophila]CUI17417.1 conserved hypothetical protein [Candidatus Protochlamydia naegleriophila]
MRHFLEVRSEGLYCRAGDFYIDAWAPVKHCIITHAHGDHGRPGHQHYMASENTAKMLKLRLGLDSVDIFPYDEKVKINDCWVSLHPAGHILGSAQIKIESGSTTCVVSGDYKRAFDSSCEPFSLQQCDLFVTESTFALPIYNWEEPVHTAQKIFEWWQENKAKGFASVLFCYALGKAQRILSLLQTYTSSPIYLHGAILTFASLYEECGVVLGSYLPIHANPNKSFSGELILAPPMAKGTPWMKRFLPYKTALASGWMQVRGMRRRKNLDRGFALSDHADWQELLRTVKETGATTVLTTHGNTSSLARYLKEQGLQAAPLNGMEWLDEGEGEV